MNRQNQLTIQPRVLNCGRAILSILSIFRLARPRSKTVFDSFSSFSSLSFSLSLFMSFFLARIIPFLLYHRLAFLIWPSPFLRPRCNATKRALSERIVPWDRNIVPALPKIQLMGYWTSQKSGRCNWMKHIFIKIDLYIQYIFIERFFILRF